MGRAEYNPAINIAALPIQQRPLGCRIFFERATAPTHTWQRAIQKQDFGGFNADGAL